jgi:acylphosphatase
LRKASFDIKFKAVDMSPIARQFFIRGDVQGVGYRFFAQRASARHQVVGFVKNLDDGRVEVLAEGPAPNVEAFKHELLTGPRFSSVDHIEEINVDPTGSYSSFRIEP